MHRKKVKLYFIQLTLTDKIFEALIGWVYATETPKRYKDYKNRITPKSKIGFLKVYTSTNFISISTECLYDDIPNIIQDMISNIRKKATEQSSNNSELIKISQLEPTIIDM